jgi:dolichol kinase
VAGKSRKEETDMMHSTERADRMELNRQLLHIILGLAALAVLIVFGKNALTAVLFFVLIIGLLLINRAYFNQIIWPAGWFIENFERNDVRFPGWGSACYATGMLILSSFLADPNMIAAGIIIIGVGDGLSTIIGLRFGKTKLPYNKSKSLEGSAAFFVSSLLGYAFVGPLIFPAAFIAMLVESLPLPMDDNLTIPIALTALFMLV